MAADSTKVVTRIGGLAELKAALRDVPQQLRKKVLVDALRAGGRVVQKAMRAATPVINENDRAVRKGYRKPGTLRKAISVRLSRISTREGNVGVFVNVRPAKGAKFRTTTSRVLGLKVKTRKQVKASQRGAKSPNDPYYWRWVNFGTKNSGKAAGFIEAGAAVLEQGALPAIVARIGPAIQRLNTPRGRA